MISNLETCIFETLETGIAILTLNRPKELNALNLQMMDDVMEACDRVNRDDSIKVLVITGNGRGFSAGGDLSKVADMCRQDIAKEAVEKSSRMVQSVYNIEKPVVAAVNGPVAGASTSLMMACDLIIAAENASIVFPFTNIGFCPDSGCSYFLPKSVGYHKAMEILLFAKTLSAKEACEIGLINKAVQQEAVLQEAVEWAGKLAGGPLVAIRMDKRLLRCSFTNSFTAHIALEDAYQIFACTTEDFKEGIHAMLEKRKPDFKGR